MNLEKTTTQMSPVNTEFFAIMNYEANRDPEWALRMASAAALANMALFAAAMEANHYDDDSTGQDQLSYTD